MILISYDISNTKLRTKFMKYILKYGTRVQFSVYEIDNSPRILKNIIAEINSYFLPKFSDEDSVLILNLSNSCNIVRMGNLVHDSEDLIIV